MTGPSATSGFREQLEEELQEIARAKRLDGLEEPFPAMTTLISEADRDDSKRRASAINQLLIEAIDDMPDGEAKQIAVILYGRTRSEMWRNLTQRRYMAADVINLSVDTLRRNYEPQVREVLISRLLEITEQHNSINPDQGPNESQLGDRRWVELIAAFVAGVLLTLIVVALLA